MAPNNERLRMGKEGRRVCVLAINLAFERLASSVAIYGGNSPF